MSIKDLLYLFDKNNSMLKIKKLQIVDIKTKINKYAFILVLMMSLLLVEVSTNQYQNQSTTAIRLKRVNDLNRSPQTTTNITTTTSSTTIVTKSEVKDLKRKSLRKLNIKASNSTVPKKTPATEKLKSTSKRKSRKDLAKRMRADVQPQYRDNERLRQHHQQNQQQRYQHYSTPAETAYLVERANDENQSNHNVNNDEQDQQQQHEQPNYGTWRNKARRMQASVKHAATNETINSNITSVAAASSTILPASQLPTGASGRHATNVDYHVYERLPRRSATMTPIRSDYHDQLPRPPRLTSRRPSLLVRRQYLETPINVTFNSIDGGGSSEYDQKPKPFQFPYEGPMPAEFKKPPPERFELNNIQEILQQLQLNGAAAAVTPTALRTPVSPQPPQLVMLPTGLHLAGSFKNFKSSGLANFFRSKRNKKQLQLGLPLQMQPLSMPKPLPLQFYNHGYHHAASPQQPYQQRIAMDQFYAFKPRSPNEINLLAMQQQLNAKRVKNKKKALTQINNNINPQYYGYNSSNNFLLPQINQRPAEHFMPFYPPQWLVVNSTQKPKLKRIPFKVNLDIFPMMAPTKAPSAAFPLRNPYLDYNPYQFSPMVMAQQQQQFQHEANFVHPQQQQQQQQQRQKQKQQQQQQASSSNSQIIYPDAIQKHTQPFPLQQQQQQQQQQPHEPFQRQPLNPQQNSFTPIDFDCIDEPSNENSSPNSNANQIMLHLNVYPKQRTSTTTPLPLPLPSSTNPFYNNYNRNAANVQQSMAASMESRNLAQQTAYANDTMQQYYPKSSPQRISRSDDNYATLVDYEHPIVAADVPELLPKPAALISNKLDDTDDIAPHYDHIELRNNFVVNDDFDSDPNIEQMSSEARTATLFRYPVEDLIHFHVDDAL